MEGTGTVYATDISNQKVKEYIRESYEKAIDSLLDPTTNMSEEERKKYEQKILSKLKSGKSLSSEEMNYLQIHNPAMYRTAMRVALKKQSLRERLKHCKSKEEANDVIFGELSGVSDKDPDKEYIVAGIRETARKFREDSRYARLPDTKEQAKKQKKNASYDFEEDDGSETSYSPIIEVLETLPTFDTLQ